jgi:hypothetical protein
MSTTTLPTTTSSDHERSRRLVVPVGAGSFLVAAFLMVVRSDSRSEWLAMVPVALVAALLIFGLVVPRGLRHESAGGRGVAMGLVGLLLVVPGSWSGLPLLLGAAAALLGNAGRRAERGSGPAMAALVLGVLSVVAYVAFYTADWIANPGASWLG